MPLWMSENNSICIFRKRHICCVTSVTLKCFLHVSLFFSYNINAEVVWTWGRQSWQNNRICRKNEMEGGDVYMLLIFFSRSIQCVKCKDYQYHDFSWLSVVLYPLSLYKTHSRGNLWMMEKFLEMGKYFDPEKLFCWIWRKNACLLILFYFAEFFFWVFWEDKNFWIGYLNTQFSLFI